MQVGIVVRNLAEAIERYEGTIGIGPFNVLDFKPEKNFIRGRSGDDMYLRIGTAELTPGWSLELIEVAGGEPYHKDFLTKYGEGVQHLGFITDEYDEVLGRADALGIPILMSAECDVAGMGHVRAAYLDTHEIAGVLYEVIEVTAAESA